MKTFNNHVALILLIVWVMSTNLSCDMGEHFSNSSKLVYINKNNPKLVIVEREHEAWYYGAWDSDPPLLGYFIHDLDSGEDEQIDLSEVNQAIWIKVEINKTDWEVGWTTPFLSQGYEVDALKKAELSTGIFRNKKDWHDSLTQKSSYIFINNYYSIAGIQECQRNIKTFIIAVDNGGYILTNLDSSYKQIHSIGIAGVTIEKNYKSVKFCRFLSPHEFELVEHYVHFNMDTLGNMDSSSRSMIRFTCLYSVEKGGQIVKSTKDKFGTIQVSIGANAR